MTLLLGLIAELASQAVATIRRVVDDVIERVRMWQMEQKIEDIRRRMWAANYKNMQVPEIRKKGRWYDCPASMSGC
jgi:hypothetical protein